MSFLDRFRQPLHPPIDFVLSDQDGKDFVFDAAYRSQHHSVLVWYRGHW